MLDPVSEPEPEPVDAGDSLDNEDAVLAQLGIATGAERTGELRAACAKIARQIHGEQIRVVGEATRPQALPYRQRMTLLDVMIAVGGLTDFADGNNASVLRTSESGRQYRVRLKDLIRRGDVSANIEMRPGDVVIIPQSWF